MKALRPILFLLTAALAVFLAIQAPETLPAVAGAWLVIAVVGQLLANPANAGRSGRLMATLSATEILQDTLDAFKAMLPMIRAFATDFSSATAVKDQTIIAHVPSLPTVRDYDATTGYLANAADAENLLTDVPVTLNRLRHVPVRIKYLSQLASRKNLYVDAVKNQAYVLGKDMVDHSLTLANNDNFTNETGIDIADADVATLETVRTKLNIQKAAPIGRFGIINSTLAGEIQNDTRAGSSDFYGQLNGANGYRTFKNVAGFESVWEYPDVPHNEEGLIGFFGDRRAFALAARVPDVQSAANFLGIPEIARFETVTDPDTGLTLLGILWQQQGTFDIYMTIAVLYGVTAGRRGTGAANTGTDPAGHRLVSTTGS
jgi:hypothetical protein